MSEAIAIVPNGAASPNANVKKRVR